jgi:flavin reductase (DIM6/NTAB) family NADH-FMN oxidoreductase RutF
MDAQNNTNKHLLLADIMAMDRFPRMHLMNTISGIKGAHLLGTLGHRGAPNLGVFSSIVHVGANPPHLGFIMRPLSVPRDTYHNIKANGFFTLNSVQSSFLEKAHQTSANYQTGVSEFDEVGLTPFYTTTQAAPYVAESPIKIGLEWVEEHPIKANGTIFIVGKVVEVLFPETAMAPTGHILHEQLNTMAVSGLETYYEVGEKKHLSYARVPKK